MGDLIQPSHLIILFIMTPLGLLPILVAGMRSVKNFGWIFVINLFLGWTLVGWVVALIWALRDASKYQAAFAPPSPTTYAPPPPYNVG
jgi:hypothetical protein